MNPVRRRCVFYVSGFDPKGAAHYHGLYREEAIKQSATSGMAVEVGPRKRLPTGNSYWAIRATVGDTDVDTHYEFMRWDDVVRNHWPKHTWQLWRDVLTTTVFNLWHGSLWKMFKLSWPPALALFAPFVLLLGILLGMPLLALLVGVFVAGQSDSQILGALAGSCSALGLAWVGRRLEARYSMYWMMRSYAFTARQATGQAPELEERLDEQARRLVQRLEEAQDDEVLLVGHSSGSIMAASILARALRQLALTRKVVPTLSFLTLGQWIPLLGVLPHATAFRQELQELGRAEHLHWIDFSAPPDGCCFALTDPLGACGVEVQGRHPDRLKLLSPRFAQMFDKAAYAQIRRDKFRVHFQYLMASDRPSGYDYFLITAGELTLFDRYRQQPGIKDFKGLKLF